ncbi:VCBS repeat-containing protein [Actinomycetes bacterium KLBMP 9797]
MSALTLLGAAIPVAYGAADTAGAAASLFQPAAVFGIDAPARTVDVADVTGDGRDDVLLMTGYSATGSENGDKLFVFAQQPDGTLAPPVRYATDTVAKAFFAVLDANGDGRQDVAINVVGGINVLRQTASGTLESAGLLPGNGIPVAADVDGDGDSDLVTGGSAGIFLLTQGAGGTFTSTTISTDNVAEVEVGDVDGDGKAEVVAAPSPSIISTRLAVYRAAGSGWTRTNHPTGLSSPESINGVEVADVSGDGRADIIATLGGNKPRSQVSVLVQTADGTLATGVLHPVWDIPQPVEAADVTGDSRPDVVTVHGAWSALSVLPQTSGGGLDTPIRIQGIPYASNYTVHGLALGDINGDESTDVVIADYNSGLVVLRNNGV